MIVIESVETVADAVEDISPVFAPMVAGIAYDVELHEEEFLKLQSHTCPFQFLVVAGIVNDA